MLPVIVENSDNQPEDLNRKQAYHAYYQNLESQPGINIWHGHDQREQKNSVESEVAVVHYIRLAVGRRGIIKEDVFAH